MALDARSDDSENAELSGSDVEEVQIMRSKGKAVQRSFSEDDSVRDSDNSDETDDGSDASDSPIQGVPLGQRLETEYDQNTINMRKQADWRGGQNGKGNAKRKFKRENKNRPMEQTSKRPVPRFREVMEVGKREIKDPRFDELVGKLKDDVFKKRYAFLYDEKLKDESSQIKKKLKKSKSISQKQNLRSDLTRVQQQLKGEERRRQSEKDQAAAKAKEREAVKAGKRPFFVKKSEKKRQELVRKYEELKATGKLQKAIAKKRKKNAQKDHRYIPYAS